MHFSRNDSEVRQPPRTEGHAIERQVAGSGAAPNSGSKPRDCEHESVCSAQAKSASVARGVRVISAVSIVVNSGSNHSGADDADTDRTAPVDAATIAAGMITAAMITAAMANSTAGVHPAAAMAAAT